MKDAVDFTDKYQIDMLAEIGTEWAIMTFVDRLADEILLTESETDFWQSLAEDPEWWEHIYKTWQEQNPQITIHDHELKAVIDFAKNELKLRGIYFMISIKALIGSLVDKRPFEKIVNEKK